MSPTRRLLISIADSQGGPGSGGPGNGESAWGAFSREVYRIAGPPRDLFRL